MPEREESDALHKRSNTPEAAVVPRQGARGGRRATRGFTGPLPLLDTLLLRGALGCTRPRDGGCHGHQENQRRSKATRRRRSVAAEGGGQTGHGLLRFMCSLRGGPRKCDGR